MKNTFTPINLFVLVLISMLVIGCSTSYNAKRHTHGPLAGMPIDPGKCFDKCVIKENKYDIKRDSIKVYSDIENVAYTTKRIVIKATATEWVKKKADRNCLSENPDDCLVWSLIETPGEYLIEKIPDDPTVAGDLSYQPYQIKTLSEPEETDWKEVVCSHDITKDLVSAVQDSLTANGYHIDPIDNNANTISSNIRVALVEYQKENQLPMGQLDMETLESLGIRIDLY